MKYTRFEFRGQGFSNPKQFILRFVVLIPAIAIITGFILSKYIIAPYIFKSNHQIQREIPIYENINELKYYTVQAGVFLSIDNAELLVKRIKSNNIPAFMHYEGQYNRVLAYAGNSNEISLKRVQDLNSAGFDSVVKEFQITAQALPDNYRNDNKFEILRKVINKTIKAFNSYCDMSVKYEKREIDYIELKDAIGKINNEVLSEIDQFKMLDEFKSMKNNDIMSDCQHLEDLLGEMNKIQYDHSVLECKIFECLNIFKSLVEHYNYSLIF